MQKYPGEMVNPNNPNEESEYHHVHQDSETDASDTKPNQIAVIGGPRNIAAKIMMAAEAAGIQATTTPTYDDSEIMGNPDMKTISPAMLSLKHLSTSPYASGSKPRIEDLSVTMRKDMRKAQSKRNTQQGYGKRITKKDKVKPKPDVTTYVSEFKHDIEVVK